MDLLEAAGAAVARRSSRRPTTSPARRSGSSRCWRSTGRSSPTARRTSSSTPTSSRAPTAGTCSCSAGRTVVLDDAHHHDDAAPGERHFHERDGTADGPDPRAADARLLRPRAGRRRRWSGSCARSSGTYVVLRGHRVHRRRHRPRGVSRRRRRVHARRSRSTSGPAVAAVGTALAIGFVTQAGGDPQDTAIGVLFAGTFALGVFMFSAIQGYVARPVRLPVRQRARDRRRGPRRAGCSSASVVLVVVAPAVEGAPVRDVRPARRGGVGHPRRAGSSTCSSRSSR